MPLLVAVALAVLLAAAPAQERAPLHVAFVGELDAERGGACARFLRRHFARVTLVERALCAPSRLRAADVVVLDETTPGEAGDDPAHGGDAQHPLGVCARWDRPTVLLGRAGREIAAAWGLPGTVGTSYVAPLAYVPRTHALFEGPHAIDLQAAQTMATPQAWRASLDGQGEIRVLRLGEAASPAAAGWCAAAAALQGPEIEVMCGSPEGALPGDATVWRQGNLLHFGLAANPDALDATGQQVLLDAIHYIARFGSDRPLVHAAPDGAPTWRLDEILQRPSLTSAELAAAFAPPWRERIEALAPDAARTFVQQHRPALRAHDGRFTFDGDALALGIDVRQRGVLEQLAARLGGEQSAAAERLLLSLLADGPGAGTTPNNWRFWLQARGDALFHDPHAHVWRLDPLAYARGTNGGDLRGSARADAPAERDPAAVALAARIAARHGGVRALDDLATFRCRRAGVRFFWHRGAGWFRMENEGTVRPGTFATPWEVAIFDSAADADILRGGGPEPRPFVSARAAFRDVAGRAFLPFSLLRPTTGLRLLHDDEHGRRQLEVRLGGRAFDLQLAHVLHVDPRSDDVVAIDEIRRPGARPVRWRVAGTLAVGPLLLLQAHREGHDGEPLLEDAEWNPDVPAGAESSPRRLLGGG